jgi:hypothetical protein
MSSTAALALIATTIVALALVTVAWIRYLSAVLEEDEEGNPRRRGGTVN